MNRLSVGILSAAAFAGLVGSTTAYARSSAGTDTPVQVSPSGSASQEGATQAARPDRPRWAPCVKPAHLKHGVCVTHVVRTVVVPDPATPTASASHTAKAKPSAAASAKPHATAKPSATPARTPSAAPTRSPSGSPTGTGAPGGQGTGTPGEDPTEPGDR